MHLDRGDIAEDDVYHDKNVLLEFVPGTTEVIFSQISQTFRLCSFDRYITP
jgi:hypothetical protein